MRLDLRFCTQCGNKIWDLEGDYCVYCGTRVRATQQNKYFNGAKTRWFLLSSILGVAGLFFVNFFLQIAFLVWTVFVIKRNGISVRLLVGKFQSNYNWWGILFLSVAALVYSIAASTVFLYPIAETFPEDYQEFVEQSPIADGESLLTFFIIAVIIAPLLEEIVFRGLLFSRMTEKWGMNRGIIVSSFVFGILHLDYNPIGRIVLGIIACVLYTRTKTLITPIVLHALNNFIVFLLLLSSAESTPPMMDPGEIAYKGLVYMLIASPVVFFVLGKWWPNQDAKLPYHFNLGQNE